MCVARNDGGSLGRRVWWLVGASGDYTVMNGMVCLVVVVVVW